MSCNNNNNNCNECNDPCLGCLQQVLSKCVFVDDSSVIELLNDVTVGDNLNEILISIINLIDDSQFTPPSGLGGLCIPGGSPEFDFETWLQQLEIYVCDINPLENVEIINDQIVFTFRDASQITVDLPTHLVNETIFVDEEYGDDTTGERENRSRPFKTVNAAVTVAIDSDTIYIYPGDYNLDMYNLSQNAAYNKPTFYCTKKVTLTVENTGLAGFIALNRDIDFIGESTNKLTFDSNITNFHSYNLKVIDFQTVECNHSMKDTTSSYWRDIISLELYDTLLVSDGGLTFNPAFGRHEFVHCNIYSGDSSLYSLSATAPTLSEYSISLKDCQVIAPIGEFNGTGDNFLTVNLNLVDTDITTPDLFIGSRNKTTHDYFKNVKISITTSNPAYKISPDFNGTIELINVRFEGPEELDIGPTDPLLVNAKLQDVWSNQYPSNPMTPKEPAIERIHIDGEDGIKTITVADSPYAMGHESTLFVDSTGGDVDILFPKANRISKEITLVGAGGLNNMILTPNGAETINGAPTKVVTTSSNMTMKVFSDRNNLYGYTTISL